MAAIALLRLYALTNQASYLEKAETTLELPASLAGKFGIFAASYAIAAVHFLSPHTQVVVIGDDAIADHLHSVATGFFAFPKTVLQMESSKVVPENLPPALAETIPHLPVLKEGKSAAVVCSGFSCQPPVVDPGAASERSLEVALKS